MKWIDALRFSKNIGCRESVPAALKDTADRVPPKDADADVYCKQKVRKGMRDDRCDGDCPGR